MSTVFWVSFFKPAIQYHKKTPRASASGRLNFITTLELNRTSEVLLNDVLSKTTLASNAYKRAFKLFHTEDLELLKAVMDTEQYGRKTQLERSER